MQKHLCSSWSGTVMNIMDVFYHRVSQKVWFHPVQQTLETVNRSFSPLRNCREMEQLVIHSSPSNSWCLFIWQNLLSECWLRWIILHGTHWHLAADRVLTFQVPQLSQYYFFKQSLMLFETHDTSATAVS